MGLPLKYNLRNLARRKLRTALTVLGIGLVIATAVVMLAYGRGLLYSMRNNGDPDNVMVLSRRATDASFSSLKRGELEVLSGLLLDDVAYYPSEDELATGSGNSEELGGVEALLDIPIDLVTPYVSHSFIIRIPGVEGGRYGERKLGLVKGVDPERVPHMHSEFAMKAGRPLDLVDERAVVVGALAWARLGVAREDLTIGKELEFGGAKWSIVGIFEAAGTSAEGEIWVPIEELMTMINRTAFSYAVIKAANPAKVETILDQVNRSEQTGLRAVSEIEYYRGYAESFRTFALIAGILAFVITIGGLMVGMNTMYTAISGRVREIGMLQVIGFSKRSILTSFLLESLLIALLGGALGCALGALVNGMPMKITMGVFVLRTDILVLGIAMGLAVLIGLLGALLPARRALRLRKVDAMRYM